MEPAASTKSAILPAMRAPQPRAILCAAVLVAVPLACSKTKTNVKFADSDSDGQRDVEGADQGARTETPSAADRERARGPIETTTLSGSIVEFGDMLDAASTLLSMWSPPEPGAPPTDLEAMLEVVLVQQGFGPGFLPSIDLDGVHAAEFVFPQGQPGASNDDIELRIAMSAHDPVRIIESLPAEIQPQPIGQDVWQLTEDSSKLLFRARGDSLEVAMTMPQLDAAASLRQQVAVGPDEPRIHFGASNLPPGEIDVTEIIPLPEALAGLLSSILNETESIDIAADFGTKRDLIARVGAVAPFERLGLDPIGPATSVPSELAQSLPSEAMFVALMPWGDPAMLHTMLDKHVPVDEIPAPFDSYVDDVLEGVHAVLGQVRNEVLVAYYLDDKGRVAIALAADVDDEKAAQAGMREIWTAAEKAFKDHIALAGSSPDHDYTVRFKKNAIKAGKTKADLFTLTVPKADQPEFEDLSFLFGSKPKLEVSTLAADGKLIVVIGVGQKPLMAKVGRQLGKTGGGGLEAGGGLELARKLSNGCQYCIAVDPQELGEMIFTMYSTDSDEPEQVRKAAKDAIKQLRKIDLPGEVALAVRLEQSRGVFGFGIPKQLLFADPAKVKTLVDLLESIEAAREAAWDKSVSAGRVPGGVPGGSARP